VNDDNRRPFNLPPYLGEGQTPAVPPVTHWWVPMPMISERERLALEIYVRAVTKDDVCREGFGEIAAPSFAAADAFIAERDRQREAKP